MLSTVASTLFNRLVDAFPADRSYSRQDFSREPMPKVISDYLSESLNARIPKPDLGSSAWVDLSHAEVRESRNAYVDAVSRHLQVPAEYWTDLLNEACLQTVSYLVRPASTLIQSVFGDETKAVSSDEVFERMKPFSPYPYFREVVGKYFDQKSVNSIDRERFGDLVRRIDRQMTSDYGAQEWLRLLEPLFSLLRRVPELSGGIPFELLQTFFEEKHARELVRRMDQRISRRGPVREADLRSLFEPDEVEVHEDSAILKPSLKDHPADPRPMEVRAPDRASGPMPLWKQFERVQPAVPNPAHDAHTITGSPEPLWKKFRKQPDSASDVSALGQLEIAVLGERGARNHDLFVKHLFAGSLQDYESTLRRLRAAENWSEASQIIAQDVFLRHKINIYSEPAVAFTDAAEAKYR